jgi:glycosyltransferase involved in cell wall biosynthesis
MKILYVSQYYPPEIGAPSARVSELSQAWAALGHGCTVLTGFPNHPTGRVPREYRRKLWNLTMTEVLENVQVVRTWLAPLPNRKTWERILNYCSFCLSAIVRGLLLESPDCVIATSPQLLVGVSGLCIARAKRVPFILEVRDLWPESLIAVGVSNRHSIMFRVLSRVADMLYRGADHIVVVSPAFVDHLEKEWNVPPQKVSVVSNGVRMDLFNPGVDGAAIRAGLGLQDKFVVSFIGTVGNAHGANILIETAKLMSFAYPDVVFLVVGEGAEKQKLQQHVRGAFLSNIVILDGQPRDRIPALIRCSDVCLVLLRKAEVFKTVIPTKMLEFMACGRPVVVGVEGVAKMIVENANAGICIPPENVAALIDAIVSLHSNEELRYTLGQNGNRFISRDMSRAKTAADYLDVMSSVVAQAEMERSRFRVV